MPTQKQLAQFAKLAIKLGINPSKGQPVVINAPVEAYAFVRLCVQEAYRLGSGKVSVYWSDNDLTRLDYENVATDQLKVVPNWRIERMKDDQEKGICRLSISSPDPDLLDGIDPSKIKTVSMENMKAAMPFQNYFMNNEGQWSIVAYPNVKWARKVFPDETDDQVAVDKLWDAILSASRVFDDMDVEDAWDQHNQTIHHHADLLNHYNFKSLHFTNKYGTDLTVGLIKDHIWCGGDEKSSKGVIFNANIPTEEVFTMPDRYHIDGTVVSTKPLNYNGQLIHRFKLTFKDGVVTDAVSDDNQIVLDQLLDSDQGSRSLGEVALISYDSPISNSGLLFYNTLFDENASCHLALGACYPTTLKGGETMSRDELYALGGNDSMNHEDFMFGSEDMSVVGLTYDGQTIEVFKDGNFCI